MKVSSHSKVLTCDQSLIGTELGTNEKYLIKFMLFQRVLKVLIKHLCKKLELTKSLTIIVIRQPYLSIPVTSAVQSMI